MTIHKLKNITYDLVKMEKALCFKVIWQDRNWRKLNVEDKNFVFESKEVFVSSGYEVDLFFNFESKTLVINLLGEYIQDYNNCERRDVDFCYWAMENNTQRDEYYTRINEALKEWDEHVEQLK